MPEQNRPAPLRRGLRLRVDDEAPIQREPDVEATRFVSKTAGDIIKSKRKFGVEFEVNLAIEGQAALRRMLSREYGLVHDGSVNNGIEVVSPPLGGKRGEEQIISTCNALAFVNADADDSCGMHVHLDASDFFNKERVRVLTLKQAQKIATLKEYAQCRFVILHSSVIKELKTEPQLYDCILNHRELDTFALSAWKEYSTGLQSFNVLFSGDKVVKNNFSLAAPRGSRGSRIPLNEEFTNDPELKKVAQYQGEPCLALIGYSTYAVVSPQTTPDELVIVVNSEEAQKEMERVERLKRVAAFYVAFDDVIASMLPNDRRDNDFSKRVNVRLSIADIARCNNVLDFFNVWTKTKSLREFLESFDNPRHESRYYGVNFRALVKHGTIEIRYHAGTTDAVKTLHWVALHQSILDLAADLANPRFNLDRLEKAAMVIDKDAKTNLFFKKLGLDEETEKFFLKRIDSLRQEDTGFVDSLLADDGLSR